MRLFEIRFKVMHDCPVGNISRKYSSLKMFEWCNREHEVLELILGNQEEYPAILEELSKTAEIIDEVSDGHKVHLITKMCTCGSPSSVSKHIDELNLLHISPTVYEQGWEYFHVVAFKHEHIEKLLKRLKTQGFDVKILRKVSFDGFISSMLTLTADALFSKLTEKQMDALLTAYSQGYFKLPRRSDVQTIAARKQVPRTTFLEHLKKAENKIVSALIPHIQLFMRVSRN